MKTKSDAFRTLYEANHQRVSRLLARIVGPQESEDLAQLVFAKVAAALPGFRGDADSSTWIYRIAANVASDWLRSRAAHEAKARNELPESDELAESDKTQASPEQDLIRKEMNQCIRGVIAQLADNDRNVLLLGELGGLGDDEVARALGITLGSAKVRLHRARQRLREALTGRCDFYRNEENEFACEPKPLACGSSPRTSVCSATAKSGR